MELLARKNQPDHFSLLTRKWSLRHKRCAVAHFQTVRRSIELKEIPVLYLRILVLIVVFQTITLDGSLAETRESDLYPELGVAEDYRHVANLMTDILIEKTPELADHRTRMLSLIFLRMSTNSFEREMLTDYEILKKGHTDHSLRSTPEYKQERDQCDYVTRNLAIMVVSHAHDVYIRKFFKPDDVTTPLFTLSTDSETDLIISWIKHSVGETEFREHSGSRFPTTHDDKIYFYESPLFSWNAMFGRAGYAVFRNGKLVEKVVTRMN